MLHVGIRKHCLNCGSRCKLCMLCGADFLLSVLSIYFLILHLLSVQNPYFQEVCALVAETVLDFITSKILLEWTRSFSLKQDKPFTVLFFCPKTQIFHSSKVWILNVCSVTYSYWAWEKRTSWQIWPLELDEWKANQLRVITWQTFPSDASWKCF